MELQAVKKACALLGVALLLASCTQPKPPPPPPPPVPTVETPPLPRQKPRAPVQRPKPIPPKPPEITSIPEEVPPPDIALVGMSRAQVVEALGEPTEQNDRGAGKSWVYRAPSCTVELTFFFDVSRNEFYALDRKVDGMDGTEPSAQRCLRQLHDMRPPQ